MTDIKSMNLTEMAAYFKELGEPAFRAKQVFQWLHRGVFSFDEMTNLSKLCGRSWPPPVSSTRPVERKQVSALDGTIKYLWRLGDGNCIETVLMQLSSWEYCVHLLSGGMPHGLCFLRLHTRGQGAGLNTR